MASSAQENFSFVEAEKKVLDFWKTQKIFEKTLQKTQDKTPYIFYDGPPFATGLPHHGHLVASTLKDIVPRYFSMKGFYVSRRWGWDCHGLPIEQIIDKQFGVSANDYVKKHGIKAYCDACRDIVFTYTHQWQHTVERLGRWVDFENDYKTMDLDFMESVWWVFKQVWDKGLIYKGNKVVPYSTALQTGLSNFEATSNYQDIQDPAVTVLFKIQDEDAYLTAWTTTPWTLPSNLALCVNADVDYIKVKDLDKDIELYLAKARYDFYAKKRNLEIVQELKGKDLIGKKYIPLFPYFKELENSGAFRVLADDYVTTTDGTGIVHQAPAFGEDDNRIAKLHNIPTEVCPIDNGGNFTDEVSDYQGLYFKEADKEIIKRLKEEGKLYQHDTLVHSYPFCYRTDTPLMYRIMPQWYLKVDDIKEKLLKSNSEVNWVPEHIKDGRFGKWLEGARDWAISRNRFWGTPLPVWINETNGKMLAIGSIEELKKYTGVTVNDLHRETVDDLEIKLDSEEGVYKRITDVFDCWFESGSMPYAQLHYPFENEDVFKKGFPAEFIAEGLDQTRGWFYTLTVLSTALYEKPAFKNVIVNGLVLAGDGKKMSKRLKNYTEPDVLMNEFGADALRLTFINSGLVRGEELRFTDEGVKDMVRRALLPWYNSFKFFQTYAEVDGWSPEKNYKLGENILDRWLISKLQTLAKTVTYEMDHYRLYNVVPRLFHFIEDLTNWYIRLNRRRFWGESLSDDKCEAYSALYTALKELSKVMAPFAPYLSDYIFLELKKLGATEEESVHLCDYPTFKAELIDDKLEDAVTRMQEIILLGRQKRNQAQVKVKTPLASLTVIHQDQNLLDEVKKLESYLKTELNVKSIHYTADEDKYIKLYAKPNSPILGKRFGKNFAQFRNKITELVSSELKKIEAGENIIIDNESFSSEEILVFREAKEGSEALSNRIISIELDMKLNQELVNEGLAREVVNRIQKSRKDSNFNVDDRIEIEFETSDDLSDVINAFKDYIQKETLTIKLSKGLVPDGSQHVIDDKVLKLSLKKAN